MMFLTTSQINFLQYCKNNGLTTDFEDIQIEDCKRNGYVNGGKMQIAFNELRDNYLTMYEIVARIR